MSIKLMSLVFSNPDLNTTEKMVLLALADAANDEGICYPGYNNLLVKTGIKGRSTLSKTLSILEEKHYITRSGRASFGQGKETTQYLVHPKSPATGLIGDPPHKSNPRIYPRIGPSKSPATGPKPNTVPTSTLPEQESAHARKRAAPRSRLTLDSLPADWETEANKIRPDLHLAEVWLKFAGYHVAKGTLMASWKQAWLNWCRTENTKHATYRQSAADRIQQANRIHDEALRRAEQELGGRIV